MLVFDKSNVKNYLNYTVFEKIMFNVISSRLSEKRQNGPRILGVS